MARAHHGTIVVFAAASGRFLRLRAWRGSVPRLVQHFLSIAGPLMAIAACTTAPPAQPPRYQTSENVQAHIASGEVSDQRGRFREIFCAILDARGASLPDYRPCELALRDTGPEAGATAAPVALGGARNDFITLLVPGLGWNCFEAWLDIDYSGPRHVANYGFDVRLLPVDGLSSTASNAVMIRDYVTSLPAADRERPLVLMGYSKGAPDILEAIVRFPDLAERVSAVVSVAGAVHGSPLANDATQAQANMLSLVPGSTCDTADGDNDAVASLKPDTRERWLHDNPLPAGTRYYSVVTFPEEARVSWALKNSYMLLGKEDVRNDTQVIIFDQMIPGSSVLALVNADHWAIAVPVARSHPLFGSTLIDKNDYPREAFLEALLRYMDETMTP